MEKLKILIVDDEPLIVDALSELFEETYHVFIAYSGEQALKIIHGNSDIAIVLSDQRMPGMKGVELLKKVKEVSPDTIRILITGYSDAQALLDSVNIGEVFQFIRKPWQNEVLNGVMTIASASYCLRKNLQHDELNFQEYESRSNNDNKISSEPSSRLTLYNNIRDKFIDKVIKTNFNGDLEGIRGNIFKNNFCDVNGKPKIMIVDDDAFVLSSLAELFGNQYNVIACTSASSALNVLKKGFLVSVVISDQRMPEKTGTELLIELQQIIPIIPKILLTAHSDVDDVVRLINEGEIFRYIHKPWNGKQLRDAVAAAVEFCRSQIKSAVFKKKLQLPDRFL